MLLTITVIIVGVYLKCVAFLTGCLLFRRSWPPAYKWLFVLTALYVFVDLGSTLWSGYTDMNNLWWYNSFWPVQSAGLIFIFYTCAVHPGVRRFNGWLLALLPILLLVCWWPLPSFYELNIPATLAGDFLVLLSACAAIADELSNRENVFLFRQPVVWLALGVLFYCVGFIFYYATWEYNKKMILFGLFTTFFFGADYMLSLGIMASFVCLYFREMFKKEK